MDLRSAQLLARQLLDEHGLTRWRVELDSAVTRAGVCRYADRTIGLSGPLTRLHDETEVRETILHEVAHALAGPRAQHGPRWRAIAHSIGSSGERCLGDEAPRIEGAWVGTCPAGHRTTRHRRPTRVVACGRCSRRFDLRHLLTWTHRGRPGVMHVSYRAELEALRSGTTPAVALAVGTPVRITVPGRYAGRSGRIVRRGRTRFHVACGDLVLEVPFAGVAAVGTPEPLR
ncbi:SprT-like domain-containing protein [Dermatophilaceae bacterium Soc4.6]